MKLVGLVRVMFGLKMVWNGKTVTVRHGDRVLESCEAASFVEANAAMRRLEKEYFAAATAMC